ncbi:ferredoxin reductase [Spongisporangium articulatum]|uniref:Ferredoxin reductase n=1 Tax=Spongisporangium articulatum TaxID=3362603 RepID=A0ABW8AJQ1_9ACTN
MTDLPPLPSLGGSPGLDGLPPLPTLGAVNRRPPANGARRAWQPATVTAVSDLTPTARSFFFALPAGTERHVPGQHYDIRLTAPDGSQAQRSYSIASAPGARGDAPTVELSVERIADGAVSPYLHDLVHVGDSVELRGPFGGWFIWRGDTPVVLVGGGSGIVPLMSMLRYWRALGRPVPLHLVVSVRTPEGLYYAEELAAEGASVTVVYTRAAPEGAERPPGRLSAADLAHVVRPFLGLPGATAYVCGGAGFAETASQLLVELGLDRSAVRVERFGPG